MPVLTPEQVRLVRSYGRTSGTAYRVLEYDIIEIYRAPSVDRKGLSVKVHPDGRVFDHVVYPPLEASP